MSGFSGASMAVLRSIGFFFSGFLAIGAADAQDLRESVSARLSDGHLPIPYGQTDEAMRDLYADPLQPGNIVLFYTGRSQSADLWVNIDAQNGWNREHLWPQSRGVRPQPMKSDLHALRPADASVNRRRGNLNFDDGGNAEGEAPNTFFDADSFEPRDDVKGDVARALFYMDVRYEGSGGEPDLRLVDDTPASGQPAVGDLCTLLDWHSADPVDEVERALNDGIEGVQGNRNVFVDEPELVAEIYSGACEAPVPAATGTSRELVVAAWNIANLGAPGSELRGYDRSTEDYDRIEDIIDDFDADVIAFQEIGSIAALEAVLPDGYVFQFETRCLDNESSCATDANDIYNAIAVREDLSHAFFQIDQLAVLHQNECGDPARAVRGGVGVDLTFDGQRYLIPSIHLKATCKDNSIEPGTEDDCATQRLQVERLRAWMDAQEEDATIILAGDFNRKLLDDSDLIRRDFFAEVPQGQFLPSAPQRACWSTFDFDFRELSREARANNPQFDNEGRQPWMFTPKSSSEIDFFVIENLADGKTFAADQIELPGDYVFRDPGPALTQCDGSLLSFDGNRVLTFAEAYPSDHCPIILEVK